MSFDKFLQERLFTPLGMKDTTFWPTEEQAKRLAKTYVVKEGKPGSTEEPIHCLHYPLTDLSRGACPAGGLFSTAEDISKFCQMLLNKGVYQGKRYLSEGSVRKMTTTQFVQAKRGSGLWIWLADPAERPRRM